jgi:4-aminobutyrate aminotransferase-like enzyme
MSHSYDEYMNIYNSFFYGARNVNPPSVPVALRGENDTLWVLDENGERPLVDANSGCFGPISIGYSNPHLVEAICRQASKLIHNLSPYMIADTVLEFCQKLASVAPTGFHYSHLVTGGSLANEAAMRICWQLTGKRGVIALQGAFHGWTVGVNSVTSYSPFKLGFNTLPGVSFIPRPYCYRCYAGLSYPSCGLRCAYELEETLKYGGGQDAAMVMMEPIQGFGGHVTPPSSEYFKVISEICKKHDLLLLIDEVQTGIGKTGEWFATQLYDIPADIITLGKGLGGGVPIGAVMVSDELMERMKRSFVSNKTQAEILFYHTHAMDPLTAAAGIAVIEYVEQNGLVERSRRLGEYLTKSLLEIQSESSILGDVRGPGLYVGVEFVKDAESKEPFVEGMNEFLKYALAHGVHFQNGGHQWCVLKIKPPLTIEEKNLDKIIEVIRGGVKAVEEKLLPVKVSSQAGSI